MLVVGLTGGIGSGKSHVARAFQELGAGWIDADRIGHEVLDLKAVRDRLVAEFGSGICDPSGRIDRRSLGGAVFGETPGSQSRLGRLESVVHPEIGKLIEEQLENFREEGRKVVILDAPLMFRTGWDLVCHRIVFVDCPLSLRLERCRERGWSRADLLAREARQLSLKEKRERAGDVIRNDRPDDPEWLNGQIRKLWREFLADSLQRFPSPSSRLEGDTTDRG